ncbi:hypothetical protein LCGC14_1112690 [marine sediment metagenome]|uniref:Uncharacterized protein n=1 Tax=marine sediment metagenome TaxID=412755 RepID=A0A0F9M6A5_9ZZZZ
MGFIGIAPPPHLVDAGEIAFWERAYLEMATHFAGKQKRKVGDELSFSRLCTAFADRAVITRRTRLIPVDERDVHAVRGIGNCPACGADQLRQPVAGGVSCAACEYVTEQQ